MERFHCRRSSSQCVSNDTEHYRIGSVPGQDPCYEGRDREESTTVIEAAEHPVAPTIAEANRKYDQWKQARGQCLQGLQSDFGGDLRGEGNYRYKPPEKPGYAVRGHNAAKDFDYVAARSDSIEEQRKKYEVRINHVRWRGC